MQINTNKILFQTAFACIHLHLPEQNDLTKNNKNSKNTVINKIIIDAL